MANFDFSQLAGLAALANDPQASAMAREYLSRQALQERALAAQQQIEDARNAIQQSQFGQQMTFQQGQAQAEESRFSRGLKAREAEVGQQRADEAFRFGADLDLKKKALQSEEDYRNAQLDLSRREFKANQMERVRARVKDFMTMVGGPGAVKNTGVTMQDLLKDSMSLKGSIESLILKGQKDPKALAEAQNLLASGYAVTGETGGLEITPRGQRFDQLRNAFEYATVGEMDPEERKMFMDQLSSLSFMEKADAGVLSPDEVFGKLNDVGTLLTKAVLTGDPGLIINPQEQRELKAAWDALPSSMEKQKAIDGIIANAAVQIAAAKGIGEEGEKILHTQLDSGFGAAINNAGYDPYRDFQVTLDELPGTPKSFFAPGLPGGVMPGISGGTRGRKLLSQTPQAQVFKGLKPVGAGLKKAFGKKESDK